MEFSIKEHRRYGMKKIRHNLLLTQLEGIPKQTTKQIDLLICIVVLLN